MSAMGSLRYTPFLQTDEYSAHHGEWALFIIYLITYADTSNIRQKTRAMTDDSTI